MEYQQKEQREKRVIPVEEETEGKECPDCHSINDTEAKFCAECGYDFTGGRKCPKCGAKVIAPDADICEVCGEWLLEGKCKFCYADLEETAKFCPECGNPVQGIICPQCGKLSYFDFCKHCDIPLTSTAHKMIERVKNNPEELIEKFPSNQEARAYYMAQRYLMVGEETKAVEPNEVEDLRKMKEYIEKVEKKEKNRKAPKPLFNDEQIRSINSLGKLADDELKRQEEERRRREEEEKRRRPKGWLCNAYRAFHPGGPCECADPSKGGHWVY